MWSDDTEKIVKQIDQFAETRRCDKTSFSPSGSLLVTRPVISI